MNEKRIRRFSPIQIAYHWAQALLYLVLVTTGAALLLLRVFGVRYVPAGLLGRVHVAFPAADVLSTIHKAAGIVLIAMLGQTIIVAVLSRRFGELWSMLREGLTWRGSDVLWMVKVPFNMLSSRVRLPPTGRLNPGEKLHVLLTATFVPGFIVSGLAMMLVPGALGPWIIHLILFFPAALFLLLHLFLALVNPETRKALSVVFTGYVAAEYARAHHSLLLADTHDGDHGSLISWRAIVATVTVVAVVTAALALLGTTWGYRVGRVASFWREFSVNEAILPGDLFQAHALEETPTGSVRRRTRCGACHAMFRPMSSAACLKCHETIREIMAAQRGYHGQLTGECVDCHTEHRGYGGDIIGFDGKAFNHNLARFALDGKHREVACDKCHPTDYYKRLQYIGLRFAGCTDCHENPHDSPTADTCERCHTLLGWKEPHVLFDHNRDSRFLLDGKHAETPCEKCHGSGRAAGFTAAYRFYEAGTHCIDCHDDPHESALGMDCTKCHTARAWGQRELHFNHNRDSKFLLSGRHAKMKCVECHTPEEGKPLGTAPFAGLRTECAACHKDPHGGQFKKECDDCHSEHGWRGRWVVDAHGPGSVWPLRGKHREAECVDCHTLPQAGAKLAAARFAGLSNACIDCHEDPHDGQMSRGCATCHSEQGWTGRNLLFAHDQHTRFPIDALHAGVACASCHVEKYRPLSKTCEGCHTQTANALSGIAVTGRGQPDPHAGRVGCTECHPRNQPPRRAAEYARDCRSCHNEHYEGLFYDWLKSLGERRARAEKDLEALRAKDAPEADTLAGKIGVAATVGFHNIQLARQLWDDVLSSGSRQSGGGNE